MELDYTQYAKFLEELQRRHWRRKLTRLQEKNNDATLMKEFYANIYDPEDGSPK